ncbi:MAG TPA: hypothetical protein VFC84_00845 [Desulfosporosinus sp.]|nr:hypothetical protein [Desulfosporosinus sp.]
MECVNSKYGWYRHEMDLGKLEGTPVLSFTFPDVLKPNAPSEKYLNVIRITPKKGTAPIYSDKHQVI